MKFNLLISFVVSVFHKKQTNLYFISCIISQKDPLILLHTDIWAPFHVHSHAAHRFLLEIIDDCTRYTRVFLLKSKVDVSFAILNFFAMIENQFSTTIKTSRSHNAKELLFTEFFSKKVVIL